MIYAAILACEIGFWVVIAAGLTARYPLRRPRLGGWPLVCAPVVDLALLTLTVVDLSHGATATTGHALAAVYLGSSVAFGHRMVHWADVRFAHRFAGGPAPVKPPQHGLAHARFQRTQVIRHALAWVVGCSLLLIAITVVADAERTAALVSVVWGWSVVVLLDAQRAASYFAWPRKPRGRGGDRTAPGDPGAPGSATAPSPPVTAR